MPRFQKINTHTWAATSTAKTGVKISSKTIRRARFCVAKNSSTVVADRTVVAIFIFRPLLPACFCLAFTINSIRPNSRFTAASNRFVAPHTSYPLIPQQGICRLPSFIIGTPAFFKASRVFPRSAASVLEFDAELAEEEVLLCTLLFCAEEEEGKAEAVEVVDEAPLLLVALEAEDEREEAPLLLELLPVLPELLEGPALVLPATSELALLELPEGSELELPEVLELLEVLEGSELEELELLGVPGMKVGLSGERAGREIAPNNRLPLLTKIFAGAPLCARKVSDMLFPSAKFAGTVPKENRIPMYCSPAASWGNTQVWACSASMPLSSVTHRLLFLLVLYKIAYCTPLLSKKAGSVAETGSKPLPGLSSKMKLLVALPVGLPIPWKVY